MVESSSSYGKSREESKPNFYNFDEGIRYKIYQEFLERRREISQNDLKILSQNFNIEIKKLIEIRENIRKIIFGREIEGPVALITTYHLLPWELEYYRLAQKRINLLGYGENIFSIPIGYMKVSQEKPHIFKIGDREIDYAKLIFNLTKIPETSYDFYLLIKKSFLEFLGVESLLESIDYRQELERKINDENFINERLKPLGEKLKNFNLLKKEDRIFYLKDKEIEQLYLTIIINILYLIADFLNFFEGKNIDNQEGGIEKKWEKTKEVFSYLINQQTLLPLFERLDINIQNYDKPSNYGKLIFLLIILGGFDHIGAEWATQQETGKYNKIREILGLPILSDIPPNIFLERFSLTEENFDSLILRILFNDVLESIFYSTSIEGKPTAYFSPIKLEYRKRIKIIDFFIIYRSFYERLKNGEIKISNSTLKYLFEKYFETYLREEIPADLKERIKIFFEDKAEIKDIVQIINDFNNIKENREYRTTISFQHLMRIIAENLLKIYLEEKIIESLEEEEIFSEFSKIANETTTLEQKLEDLSKQNIQTSEIKFGGIKIPLELTQIDSSFLLYLLYLINKFL
ncbi:MAG: hypothetical protein NZ866_01760 [Patescibacteria group bacterium]|nr:hypothetical protein [Patescibacteria group bacterium]